MIQIENVYKSLAGEEVLKGVNLEIPRGELLAIIGGSGSGKSVLLKHVIGFLKPDSGDVIVEGVSIPSCSRRELYRIRRKFGVVFQSAALLQSLTVGDNVGLPLREHSICPEEEIVSRVVERLSMVSLDNVEDKLPAELSGGMQKRASLARAIIMNPDILLFDEPETGLDPVLTATIGQLIIDLHNRIGFTAIAVTHNMRFAYMIADRIAMLYNGRILESGTPEEIKNTSNPIVRQFILGLPDTTVEESGFDQAKERK